MKSRLVTPFFFYNRKHSRMDRFIKAGFKTCFIVRGLPGSGKTYLAHSIRKELDTLGYSTEMAAADDYLVNEKGEYAFDPENLGSAHMACSKKLVSAMKQGVDAVIQHNTNVKDWESQVVRSCVTILIIYYIIYIRLTTMDTLFTLSSQRTLGLKLQTFRRNFNGKVHTTYPRLTLTE